MSAALLIAALVAISEHPLIRQAEQAKAQLAYKEALGLLDLAFQEELKDHDRRAALVLRAELLAGWQCNLAAVQAFHAVLTLADYAPPADASPKVIDCFDIAVGTRPTASPPAEVAAVLDPETPWRWVSTSAAITAAVATVGLYAYDVVAARGLRRDIATTNGLDTTADEQAALRRRKRELKALDLAVLGGGLLAASLGGVSVYLWVNPAGGAVAGVEGAL